VEYVIHVRVVAPQENVNIYLIRRLRTMDWEMLLDREIEIVRIECMEGGLRVNPIYIYICVCVCVFVCVYVCMYVYIYMCVYIYTYIYIYM